MWISNLTPRIWECITKKKKKKELEEFVFYSYCYLSCKSKDETDKTLDKHAWKGLKRI